MENLSSEELSLLLAIKRKPNMRLAMYGNSLKIAYIKALHARNDLLHKDLILENGEGIMQVNEKVIEEQNIKLILANGEQPDPKPEVVAVETETVKKFEDVDKKVLELLQASPNGRTAKELAQPFGTKGTSLNWTLRALIKKGMIVKRDVKYFMAEECDKVVNVPVVVDERRVVDTSLEIRSFILQHDESHTQDSLYEVLSRAFIIDKNKFCEVFSDLVLDGYYNVHDGVEFVQHDLDFSPTNQHKRCANISSDEGIGTTMNDFVCAWETFDLSTAVRETNLRHDRITKHLAKFGWDVSNQNKIFKPKAPVQPVNGYTKFEDIDVASAHQLIFGIVKLEVFMKRFNLDPASKDEVVKLLELVKMAKYDVASGYLGPIKPAPAVEEEIEEPVEETVAEEIPEVVLEQTQLEKQLNYASKETFTKFVAETAVEPVPEIEMPTHITNRNSPLYGHPVLGRKGEQLNVSTTPDLEWIASQPDATENEKALLENILLRYPMRVIVVDEIDPAHPEEIELTYDWADIKKPLELKGEPEPQPEEPVAPKPKVKSFAEIFELQEDKRKCWCNKPEHDLRVGPCGPSGPDDSGLVGPAGGEPANKPVEPKIVNPQWAMTLQMLAERFQHEHQYTTANVLREIHDYLVPK